MLLSQISNTAALLTASCATRQVQNSVEMKGMKNFHIPSHIPRLQPYLEHPRGIFAQILGAFKQPSKKCFITSAR